MIDSLILLNPDPFEIPDLEMKITEESRTKSGSACPIIDHTSEVEGALILLAVILIAGYIMQKKSN